MLNQFRAILYYYRPLALWSFLVTIILTVVGPELILALLTKLFLMVLFWFLINDTRVRKKLKFYKMVGVSNFKLITVLYILDCFITCSFLLLIKGFI
jgi:hypothetical protein